MFTYSWIVRFSNIHFILLTFFVIILYRYKIFISQQIIREVLIWGLKNYKKIFPFFQ